jgi:hypothetical protein
MIGGDSLEENFVLGSSVSSDSDCSESEISDKLSDVGSHSLGDSSESGDQGESAQNQPAKKVKLNWREAAAGATGSPESQRSILEAALSAFGKFFPKLDPPFTVDDLEVLNVIDISSFLEQEDKAFGNLLRSLSGRPRGFPEKAHSELKCIILTGSATRAMYLVKEVRETSRALSPLPLFFHGGGRKKEQSQTHESVLRGRKSTVAVCLPSRLRAVAENNLIDFKTVDLIVIDLKRNEKGLNVLSQKDTMMDLLEIVGKHVIPYARSGMQLVMI